MFNVMLEGGPGDGIACSVKSYGDEVYFVQEDPDKRHDDEYAARYICASHGGFIFIGHVDKVSMEKYFEEKALCG